jgi:hypothetical protein
MCVKACQNMVDLNSIYDEQLKRDSSSIFWYVILYSLVEGQKKSKLSK